MAYERTNWTCETSITPERMNNIEDGIEEALECCNGGNSAEVIKIAECSCTSTELHAYALYKCYGNGQTVGGRTLGDIIGDKTIVGFTASLPTYDSHRQAPIALDVMSNTSVDDSSLIINQDNTNYRNSTTIYYNALANSPCAVDNGIAHIYAICI